MYNLMTSTVLEVSGLSKTYSKKTAVDQISFQVEKGQVFGILGPNGSGKTTTLSMILDIIRPSGGSFSWFNKGSDWQARSKVGALVDTPNYFPWSSVDQHFRYWSLIKGKKVVPEKIDEILEITGLSDMREKPVGELSLGMKQRYGLACSLLDEPEVIILDEPTISIDARGIVEIRELIQNLAKKGTTVILASHILDEVEKVCSHLIILNNGKIIEQGAIDEVLQFDNTIEVGATDLAPIMTALSDFEGCKDIVRMKGAVSAKIEPNIPLEKVNEYLAAKGIFVSRLEQKRRNLENHFLKLLDN